MVTTDGEPQASVKVCSLADLERTRRRVVSIDGRIVLVLPERAQAADPNLRLRRGWA